MRTNFLTKYHRRLRRFYLNTGLVLLALGLVLPAAAEVEVKTVTADVVILDHVLVFNRLGAQNVNGMIYALERDVIQEQEDGFWKLRPDKRPRPLVLRVSAGDTLVVNFTNLLTPAANPFPPLPDEANPCIGCPVDNPLEALDNQVDGRWASFHVQGMQLVNSIDDDGSYVGQNDNSLTPTGSNNSKTYTYRADKEGTFLVTSMGATFGGEATGGNVGVGAFAVVNVEPADSKDGQTRYYRSQVTEEELRLAADCDGDGVLRGAEVTADGHPVLAFPGTAACGYNATYPATNPDSSPSVWFAEGKAGLPILNMINTYVDEKVTVNEIVHADLNAIITGSNPDGSFPDSTYPAGYNPVLPNRLEPFSGLVHGHY